MAPTLEVIDLTDDAEISPVKLSGGGNRVQSHPKLKAELEEKSSALLNSAREYRVSLLKTLCLPNSTPGLETRHRDFLKKALVELSDNGIHRLARGIKKRVPQFVGQSTACMNAHY